jgi:integrase
MNGAPRYLTKIGPYWYYEREIPARLRPHFLWEGERIKRRLRIATGESDLGKASSQWAKTHQLVESALAIAAGQIRRVIHDQTDQEIAEMLALVIRKYGPSPRLGDVGHYHALAERELEGVLGEGLKQRYQDMIAPALMSSLALPAPSYNPIITVQTPVDVETQNLKNVVERFIEATTEKADAGPSLKEVIERIRKDKASVPSFYTGTKAAFDRFCEIVGEDTPFRSINRTHCREFKNFLVDDEYKPSTTNSYLDKISNLFTWALQETIVESIPALGLHVKNDGSEKTGFTNEELNKLFPLNYSVEDNRFWLPLIMIFQGCRPNEACQLPISDIIIDHDIPHFFFHEKIIENGVVTKKMHSFKSIKEIASNRRVPIHPGLIKLGFLEYVKSRKNMEMLFDMNKGNKPRFWDNNYQWFHDKFLGDVKTEDKTMHGLRYTWKEASQRIRGESGKQISELAGWSTGKGAEDKVYRTFTDLEVLLPVLSKVQYDVKLFNRT